MRQITEQAANAFNNAISFNKSGMKIEVLPNVTVMSLHGNEIAFQYNDPKKTLSITNCGWFTNVTKERLNSLEGVNIQQKQGIWYLNGTEWNGELIDIK